MSLPFSIDENGHLWYAPEMDNDSVELPGQNEVAIVEQEESMTCTQAPSAKNFTGSFVLTSDEYYSHLKAKKIAQGNFFRCG